MEGLQLNDSSQETVYQKHENCIQTVIIFYKRSIFYKGAVYIYFWV